MYARLASRSCRLSLSSSFSKQSLSGCLLHRQQERGIKIKRYFGGIDPNVESEFSDLDRSYNLLLSETESDVEELKNVGSLSSNQMDAKEPAEDLEPSKWDSIREKFEYPAATTTLRELDISAIDNTVIVHGYLTNARVMKNMVFLNLIDFSGGKPIQVVSYLPKRATSEAAVDLHQKLGSMKQYTPVAIVGRIVAKAQVNKKHSEEGVKSDRDINASTHQDIELVPERLYPLNDISNDIMFTKDSTFSLEDRHLQIRTQEKLLQALHTRAQVASICRSELERQGFLEVETPVLFKSTPEGAREFLVPTRQRGLMYALPQSPQQYKQILMASGVPRYFQFAKCFRDEDLRADRQPEFTQLDIEMSFSGARDVMKIMERLVKKIWMEKRPTSALHLKYPLRRISYEAAMSNFGSDKPDLRFDHSRIRDVTVILSQLQSGNPDLIVEAFVLETNDPGEAHDPGLTDAVHEVYDTIFSKVEPLEIDYPIISFVGNHARNAELLQRAKFDPRNQLRKFLSARDNQIVVIQARPKLVSGGSTPLGIVRNALLKESFNRGIVARQETDHIAWVTDFPLFKRSCESEPGQGGESGLSSNHHPFTAPRFEDIHLLETNPLQVRAEHFDLVVNGVEVGGGSARIHDPMLQECILKDIIKVPERKLSQFDHLLKVLGSGCPPHAGMALGYDRLIALLMETDSVRDVIAFPKNGKGHDLLTGSPGPVGAHELALYHLQQT